MKNLSVGHGVATLVVALLLGAVWSLRFAGLLSHQALAVVLLAGVGWGVVARVVAGLRGRLVVGPRTAAQRVDAGGRALAFLVITATCAWAFPRSADLVPIAAGIALAGAVGVIGQLLAFERAFRGVTVVFGVFAAALLVDVGRALWPPPAPVVQLAPPFEGSWLVLQGGSSPLLSHHLVAYNQRFALDLLRMQDGQLFDQSRVDLGMVHSWQSPLRAPVAGTVVAARGDRPDLQLGQLPSTEGDLDALQDGAAGNVVVIRDADGHHVVLAHLEQGSVTVGVGDEVAVGDPLGRVGNSGNTTLPHLHLQVQTHADLWHPDNRSLPFSFGGDRPLRRNDRIEGATGEH